MPFATSSVLACRDAEGESVPRGMPSSPGKLCEEGEEHLAFRLWLEDTEPKELYFSRSGFGGLTWNVDDRGFHILL